MKTCGNIHMRLPAIAVFVALAAAAHGAFDCGSNGSDGPLTFDEQTTVTVFDPASYNPPLDADNDGVYHFTTVTIPPGRTLKFKPDKVGWNPIYWLCQGDVVINGKLDFSGEDGHAENSNAQGKISIPGPGGFPGGWGRSPGIGVSARSGFGPGMTTRGGLFPGNLFLLPLIGGNGGSGGTFVSGSTPTGGGGAGGGAFLLASNTSIGIGGQILATGGKAGGPYNAFGGYGGAGGAIRLMAPTVSGGGTLSAEYGISWWGVDTPQYKAQYGVVRIESLNDAFTIPPSGDKVRRVTLLSTGTLIFPSELSQYARLVRIGGVELPARTSGSFTVPDAVINTDQPVLFEIEARNIPLGTTFTISLWNETALLIEFPTGGLAGTLAGSTATATPAIPIQYGNTRGFIYATWTK